MRDLEERSYAEGLGEVGAQTREHEVVQEDIALHLLGNILDGAGVGQAERRPPRLEGSICVSDG